jgi:sugar diacid utilization regulator
MIELELYKESVIRHQDKKNLFLNYLLYEEGTPRSVVEGLAAKLGYDSRVYRAPILLKLPEGVDSTEALSLVKGNALHTKQDISCVTLDGALLVFKTISFSGREIISEYRKEIERYISAVVATLAFDGAHNPCQTCVGVYQADFTHYRAGYRQALWTIECNFQGCDAASPVFFLDHVQEYLVSRVPRAELCNIFGATLQLLPPASVREIFASVGALFESAFNGKEAAARLGVHRNTLTARLEHIRELFGVDVRWDAHARDFLSLLALYVQLPGVISKPK